MSSSTERKQYQRQENHDCSVVNQRYLQEKSYKWLWVSIIWFHENNQIDERIWFKHLEDYEAESLRDVSVSSMQNEVFCLLYICNCHPIYWTIKKAEPWGIYVSTAVLERTLQSPLDCQEIKPVNPKGYQPWILTRKTDAKAEVPVLRLPVAKNWSVGRDPNAGINWHL